MNPTSLINISGGVDSVYDAWKSLESGGHVLLHHCVLKSRTNRWSYEKKAVNHSLSFFRNNGMKNFVYVETEFDYGTVNHLIYDVELIGFLTGLVLRNPRYSSIKKVVVSVNKDDPSGRDLSSPRRVVANSLATTVIGREIDFVYPHINMTKKQIIDDMPQDLLSGLWWCRVPKNGNKCGSCKPCKEINNIIKT